MIAEYIWLDCNKNIRSKARTLGNQRPFVWPKWTYDGSSTGQASGHDSEITMIPRAIFDCPFRGDKHKLIICDTYDSEGNPTESNTRYSATKIFTKEVIQEHQPWYGLEQEYFLTNPKTGRPLGWPDGSEEPEEQGKYYCGVGSNIWTREQTYELRLEAGVKISGINAEVAPGQWEFQVGPVRV